jgi:aspartyl-tRNA(Asn)/glutamyl-tRNA(Gln) amidotransferase subunit A
MVLIGKTETHEFAFGGITPTTRNPWNLGHIPGGSSGGSGAAVASGTCAVGMGSDTGGSIRIPASVCGTVGLKPTYGRVSRRGVMSLSWSLDHVGPLTRTVRDAALVLAAVAGYDRADPSTVPVPLGDYVAAADAGAAGAVTGLRVGVPTNYFTEGVDGEVAAATSAAAAALEGLGVTLVPVEVPYPDLLMGVMWSLCLPEASAYHQQNLRSRGDLYSPDVRSFLEVGELVLATDYLRGLRARTLVQQAFATMFSGVDAVLAPTLPCPVPAVDQADWTRPDGSTEPVIEALVRFNAPANLTGVPALSLPVGLTASGLPIGAQLMGRPFDEETLLRLGAAYESVAPMVGRIAPPFAA